MPQPHTAPTRVPDQVHGPTPLRVLLHRRRCHCILFRGQGNVSDFERGAYPKGLVVLWQAKAWVDRPLALEWAEDVIKPFIEAERKAGVAGSSTRYLLFQDNLDSQKQPDYINFLKEWGVDDHKMPPNETDQVQPIDRGFGRQVKIYLGQQVDCTVESHHLLCHPPPLLLSPLALHTQLSCITWQMDEWLDHEDNLNKWEDNTLTASDRRVLLATWYFNACQKALQGEAKKKYFEHAGALLTADGTDDDLIKFEGSPAGYKVVLK